MGRKRMHIGYWWESQKGNDQDNIKMDLEKIEWGGIHWIDLVHIA
jgi:hypothetical protein